MATAQRPQSLVHIALVALSLLCYTCTIRVEASLADDANGLILFKSKADLRNKLNWNNASNVCQWHGVQCSGTSMQRVYSLKLPGEALFGPIPPGSVGQLTQLRALSLRSNRLSGPLPADLANCSFLRGIYLEDNELSGALPSSFTVWPNLNHVDLSSNNFSGAMPSSLASLTQLKSLFLQNNFLSGPIPALNIPSLTTFSVAYNNLSGPIPSTATYRNFDAAAFAGNTLCGFPLPACTTEGAPPPAVSSVAAPRKHHMK